jgi:PKD repeat protein
MTISLSLDVPTKSGVAPLPVFFDATGTTATDTTRPFQDLFFYWDFGDTNAGNWQATDGSATGKSKDRAIGGVAAHIYENPGTYTVTLTIVAPDGSTATETTTITVSDPDDVFADTTVCISNDTDHTGAPDGATLVNNITDFDAELATQLAAGKRRILFKRGDTFTASTTSTVNVTGPGLIGAYGSGAKPIIQNSGAGAIAGVIRFGVAGTVVEDWRAMDLTIDPNGQSTRATGAVNSTAGARQILIFRLDSPAAGRGVSHTWGELWSGSIETIDRLYLVENEHASTGAGANAIFLTVTKFVALGNHVNDDTLGEHIARLQYVGKGVISHNIFSKPAADKHALTLRGPPWAGSGSFPAEQWTEYVVISDNKISSGIDGVDWVVHFASSIDANNEHIRQVVFERNWIPTGITQAGGSAVGVFIQTLEEATFRNNIIDTSDSGAGEWDCFFVSNGAVISPTPDNLRFYNNTCYVNEDVVNSTIFTVQSEPTNITIKNNLGYAPNDAGMVFLSDASGTVDDENNSTNAQVRATNPFVGSTFSVASDFKLSSGNYARGAGADIPVRGDFFDVYRGTSLDMGAAEFEGQSLEDWIDSLSTGLVGVAGVSAPQLATTRFPHTYSRNRVVAVRAPRRGPQLRAKPQLSKKSPVKTPPPRVRTDDLFRKGYS